MTKLNRVSCEGYTILELLMVFVIIGSLASIAISHYNKNQDQARSAQCESNRYHIELDEVAYYADHGRPGLVMDERYRCSSGGIYVWLVTDPEDPDYPRVGCSVHYIGDALSTDKTVEPSDPGKPSQGEKDYQAAADSIKELINRVKGLDLNKGIENSMLSRLESALNAVQEGQAGPAADSLAAFIKYTGIQKGKNIPGNEADLLISNAQIIIELIS